MYSKEALKGKRYAHRINKVRKKKREKLLHVKEINTMKKM